MACSIHSNVIEIIIRKELATKGYKVTIPRTNGETGADIIAKKKGSHIEVECIGFQDHPPTRSKIFYEVFFRAISRLQTGADEVVIALPSRFEKGLPARAIHHGVGWDRIGNAFPELKLWLVDVEKGEVIDRHPWGYWKGA